MILSEEIGKNLRPKGGIFTLVKNTHASSEVYRSEEDEDNEVIGIKMLLDKNLLTSTIYNLYSPPKNSCVPKFFSMNQTSGSSWVTPQAAAMMILIIKEMK